MKIKFISVGKVKNQELLGLIKDYAKKISFDARIELIEIKDSTIEDEADKIIEHIERAENKYVFVLSEEGKELSSSEFSDKLKDLSHFSKAILFVVGGPFGLSKKVKEKSDFLMSISKMTFTHEMCRLFLLEQVYRALSIISNKSYHK